MTKAHSQLACERSPIHMRLSHSWLTRVPSVHRHSAEARAMARAVGDQAFDVVSESVTHQRYLTLYDRRVRWPQVSSSGFPPFFVVPAL